MAGDPAVDLVKRPSPQSHQHSLPSLLISTVEIKLAVITKFLASAGREAAGGGLLLPEIGVSGQTRSRRLIRNDRRAHLFARRDERGDFIKVTVSLLGPGGRV